MFGIRVEFPARELSFMTLEEDDLRNPPPTEVRPLVILTRRRLSFYFLAGILLITGPAVVFTALTGELRYLASPTSLIFIWLFSCYLLPKEGTPAHRLSDVRELIGIVLWGGLMLLFLVIGKLSFDELSGLFLITWTVIFIVGVMILARRADREMKKRKSPS